MTDRVHAALMHGYGTITHGEYDSSGLIAPLIKAVIYTENDGYRLVMSSGRFSRDSNPHVSDVGGSADDILDAIKVALIQQRLTK